MFTISNFLVDCFRNVKYCYFPTREFVSILCMIQKCSDVTTAPLTLIKQSNPILKTAKTCRWFKTSKGLKGRLKLRFCKLCKNISAFIYICQSWPLDVVHCSVCWGPVANALSTRQRMWRHLVHTTVKKWMTITKYQIHRIIHMCQKMFTYQKNCLPSENPYKVQLNRCYKWTFLF